MVRKRKKIEFNPSELSIQLRENAVKAYPDAIMSQKDLLDSVYGISRSCSIPI